MTQKKASASVTVHYITAPEKGDPGDPGDPGKDGEDGKTQYVRYCVSASAPGMYPRPKGGGMYDMSELYLTSDAAAAGTASLRWTDTEPSPDSQGEGESVWRIDCTVPVSFGWVTDDLGESPWSAPTVWRRPPAVEVRVECDTAAVLRTGSGTYLPATIKFRGYKRVGGRAWEDCADDNVWILGIPRAEEGWDAVPASQATKGVSWVRFVSANPALTAFEAVVLSPSGERYDTISLPVVSDGPEGCVVRTRDWASGCTFEDGSAVSADGVRFLDIALTREGNARFWWRCGRRHTSTPGEATAANPTGCPIHDTANPCWIQINDVGPIYTALVLAPEARIDFLNGQEILISENETVWGRMGCPTVEDGYIMWTGGATPDTPNSGGGTWSVTHKGLSRWSNRVNSIFLNPATARLEYYTSGKRVTVFEGNRYDGPASLRASDLVLVTGTQAVAEKSISRTTFGSTTATVKLGTVVVGVKPCRATITARVNCTTTSVGSSVTSGSQSSAWGDGAVECILSVVDDASGTKMAESVPVTVQGAVSRQVSLALEAAALPQGRYTVQLTYTLAVKVWGAAGASSPELTQAAKAAVSFAGAEGDLTATAYTDPEYLAQYYANGMAIANSPRDYMMAWDEANHISFEVMSSGTYGLAVTPRGIMVRNATGGWLTFKEEVERILRVKGLIN